MQSLRETFRPEFLNRIDDIIIFHPLSEEMLASIVGLQLDAVRKRLAERDITLSFTDALKRWLAEQGFDPLYGARPLKRLIQNALLDPLALDLLEGKVPSGTNLAATIKDGQVVFSPRKKRRPEDQTLPYAEERKEKIKRRSSLESRELLHPLESA
ncbi:MAG: hypothetical protein WDN67_01730 [Candidatus Moraniibacteriota bacterium]